jgi:2-methylisocitrate lyase-like PEP mutase family enzyme
MSGFCVSAARLAMPDAGLISYGEMEDVGRHITQATADPAFPFIGDADDGYGNAMNAKRTVRGYARAGFAGILMEDQAAPKACGHTKPKVLPRDEAVARVRAACDERDEGVGGDIVVFARSDSRSAVDSLDEALWRVAAFADAGADALFIDALRSKEVSLF